MQFGTERANGCFWMVLKGFFANINMKPQKQGERFSRGGGALHGVTRLLGQVVSLPAKCAKKIPFFAEKFGEKSYLRHENFLKIFFGSFCAGSLPTRHDSVKSFTTPWEPFTLILGFMLMLVKNPFRTINKHPFALSVQKIIRNKQMWKLWISVPSLA